MVGVARRTHRSADQHHRACALLPLGLSAGAGRRHPEQPSEDFGWKAVGWGLLAIVPVFGWYAVVHLPTICYKHGVRVGANEETAPDGFTSLPALAAAFGGVAVVVVAVFVGVALAVGDDARDGDGEDGAVAELSPQATRGSTEQASSSTPTPPLATPIPACHPLVVRVGGDDYVVRFAFIPDDTQNNPIRLTEENGTEISLHGGVDAVATKQCVVWEGKCYTHWFLDERNTGSYNDAIIIGQVPDGITWEEIYTGEQLV